MTAECIQALTRCGIAYDDAAALRRIAMTLHRWHELECGNGNDFCSYAVTRGFAPKREFYRDPETLAPKWRTIGEFVYDESGYPYIESHYHNENGARYRRIADKERGAHKRLAAIMARYPALRAYIQGDPRGAALYILRPGDVPEGAEVDSYYSRGLAVYK